MPLIFLSHSDRNGELARQLRDRILATPDARDADLRVWLDLIDLDVGRPWKSQIEAVIENEATSFAVIVDPGGVQTWVAVETDAALSRAVKDDSFRFIPILPNGGQSADLSPFARRYHAIRANPLTDEVALQALIKAALGGTEEAGQPKLTDEPFPGLQSMNEGWSDRFFGRATEIHEVIAQLRANPMVVIAADSGAGKSSLAMAGVGTAWRGGALEADDPVRPPPRNWSTIAFRPFDNPVVSLANAIRKDFARRGVQVDAQADILKVVRSGDPEDLLFLLSRGMPEGDTRTLIIVDQAEELFTQTADATRRTQILKLLSALAKEGQKGARCRILFTLRADFQNQLQQCEETADRLGTLTDSTNRFRLKRLSDEGVRDMVLRPLAMAGFDDDAEAHELADRIVTDLTNDEGDLALAQFALSETWRNRGARGGLLEAYRSVDGVAGALARKTEALIETDDFIRAHEDRIVPLFFRLIRLDAQAFRISRRLAPLSEFSETDRKLITLFASAEGGRLLHTTDEFVEISHEKLITQWSRLHDAVGQNDAALRCLNRITEAALAWHENNRSGKFLTSVADEEAFRELARSNSGWVSEAEQSFLGWSRKRHWTNRLLRIAGVVAVLSSLVAAVIFYSVGVTARQEAELAVVQANQAEANALAVLGLSKVETDPVEAIKLALAAWPKDQRSRNPFPPAQVIIDTLASAVVLQRQIWKSNTNAENLAIAISPDGQLIVSGGADGTLSLWDALTGAQIRGPLRGHEGWIRSVAFSPDGQRIISGGNEATLRLWDTQTGVQVGKPLRGHVGQVWSVAFSPDGQRIVSGGSDATLRLWDAQTGVQTGKPLRGHAEQIYSVVFSSDGQRIVSSGLDGTLRLWDAQTGAQMGEPLRGHEGWVSSVAFSPEGQRIASGGMDGTLRFWDAQTGAQIGESLRGHEGRVLSVAFSPDGQRIISGGGDKTLRLWDAQTGVQIGEPLRGHEGDVYNVAFSPDGQRIVSSGVDATLRLWDAQTGAQIGEPLRGHEGDVNSVAFFPDGQRIVSGGGDKTLRLWDAQIGTQIGEPLRGHEGFVWSVAFSTDSQRIVSGSEDATLRLWDAQTGTQIGKTLRGHEGVVLSVAFSRDGRRIISGGGDATLRLWDAQTGAQMGEPLRGHEGWVSSVAFSPDGQRIVSGGSGATLRLWDVQTGAQIGESLRGHEGRVLSVAFSPDGQRIISGGGDKTLRLWDAQTGVQIGEPLRGHEGDVYNVAFSPDGQRIVSSGIDATLRLWDAQTGAQIGEPLRGHEGFVWSVAFSPDGQRIVSGGNDRTLRIWSLPILAGNLFQAACGRILRTDGELNLSTEKLAAEIGIDGLSLPENCETYDPPLPDGAPG